MTIDEKLCLETAVRASREAGNILLNGLDRNIDVQFKGEIDLVTEVDNQSQECILKIMNTEFPEHHYIAEEGADLDTLNSEVVWLIDPLDGTTNYAHGYKCFCTSIGLVVKGELRVGVIYDPCADEMYTAIKGKGAFLNGKRIHVSGQDDLNRSLLVTGFPYDIREGKQNNVGLFNHMIMKAQAVRRDGSAALDLAYLAAGRFDGFWELKLHPWDVAAGVLIVEEAGGKITDFSGGSYNIDDFDLLASNTYIHDTMINELKQIPKEKW